MHSNTHYWIGKDISININQRLQYIQPLLAHLRIKEIESPTWASTTSILHLSIASSEAKGNLGKNTKALQGTKGCRLKHKFWKQWTIVSFLSILSYSFNVPKSSLYSFSKG